MSTADGASTSATAVVGGFGQVDADESQARKEAVDGGGVQQLGGDESAQFSVDLMAVTGLVQASPGHGDDPRVGGELAIAVT